MMICCCSNTSDPPPCVPQSITIFSSGGCGAGGGVLYPTLPVHYTVTDPFGVVVFDGIVTSNHEITDTVLGVYTWTAETVGYDTFSLYSTSGSVTVHCKSTLPSPSFLPPVYIWPGLYRERDVVCPACVACTAAGVRVEGTKTLTWHGGSATLNPYPKGDAAWALELQSFPDVGGGSFYLRRNNCWAGIQSGVQACRTTPPGQCYNESVVSAGEVEILWILQLNDHASGSSDNGPLLGCSLEAWALYSVFGSTPESGSGYASYPSESPISANGTSTFLGNIAPFTYGPWYCNLILGQAGVLGAIYLDPPECDPFYLRFTFDNYNTGIDARIFGTSTGYFQCMPPDPFPITITD